MSQADPKAIRTNRSHSTRVNEPHTVLQVGPLPGEFASMLDAEFVRVQLPEEGREQFLAGRRDEFDVAVTTGVTGISGDVMRSLPRLRAVASLGVGYDSTDVDTAGKLGIAVSNTPDVLTSCVADLTVAMIIDMVRGMTAADRYLRRGAWPKASMPLAHDVRGKRVGIVGLGRIGRAVAYRLNPFSVTVGYHNRHRVPDVDHAYFDSPVLLAAWSDILVAATTGGPASKGLISREVLTALGPDGYLVNISRGSVVDEPALVELLADGSLAGAALDVFTHEPQVPAQLLAMDNVVLLPHIGSATVETRQAMAQLVVENLRSFLAVGTLTTPI